MFTNNTNIPLSLAVWLANDSYDYNNDKNVISVTTLIKPVKQVILASRVPVKNQVNDVSTLVASRMGTNIHTGIETSWLQKYKQCMELLNYPKSIIDKIRINPTTKEEGTIPIYMEVRSEKEIEGFTVSGKYDFVGDGRVEDFKTTSTYTYTMNTNNKKYILQGSIYRWLNQDTITKDIMAIQFIFTDWSIGKFRQDPKKYPPAKTHEHILPLKSIPETEEYIRNKVIQLKTLWDAPESDMPECTSYDLWRKAPVYKYYKNPNNRKRSTKNFDNISDANIRCATDGNVGIVVTILGEVVACRYCDAITICKQKDTYLLNKTLNI